MILEIEKPEKKDIIFTAAILVVIIILIVVPNKYSRNDPFTERVEAVVLSVNNDEVMSTGIYKQGVQTFSIKIENGKFKGKIIEGISNFLQANFKFDKFFKKGDTLLINIKCDEKKENITGWEMHPLYGFDINRLPVELILLLFFIVLLILFAGWTGARAVISFIFTAVVIWKILLPGFLDGINPILLSLGIVSLLTGVIIFLIGGLTKKGLIAFIGAFSGIILTCILSILFGTFFRIHGGIKEYLTLLLNQGGVGIDLTQIFYAGIFLASSGAVMDLAMDISASLQEVVLKHPGISVKEAIFSGFSVGKAVMGTMTTTLLLAYTGGYTGMFMFFIINRIAVLDMLNSQAVAAEILHTMVGSFGLVLVAPCTAIVGGFLYTYKKKDQKDSISAKEHYIQLSKSVNQRAEKDLIKV